MRRVATCYAKTRDQSDPVRGSNEDALSSFEFPLRLVQPVFSFNWNFSFCSFWILHAKFKRLSQNTVNVLNN